MKNIFKKIVFCSLFIALFFLGLTLLKDSYPISFVKSACATDWGACNPDPNYQVCPKTGVAISACVKSVDFNVIITSVGSAPIPPNTTFRIQIYPSDGSGESCPNVTCLKRTADYTTPTGWTGSPYQVTLDQIGCDLTGQCTNNFTVKINFASAVTGISCPEYNQNFNVQNGNPVPVNFAVNCTSTQTYTCAGAPGGPPVSDTEQCQQTGTGSCFDSTWTPNPSKTCPPGTTPNICCDKTACTVPAQPAPTLTCSL